MHVVLHNAPHNFSGLDCGQVSLVPELLYYEATLTVTHDAMGTNPPPPSQMLAFEVSAGNNLDGPFPL